MNYKKIIKNRNVRIRLLRMMSFIPDSWMVRIQYRIKTGNKLHLKNPKRFSEKLQWYKLYYHDLRMPQCADKGDVREYVKSKNLEGILNECYGIYDRLEDIAFEAFPSKFVLKDTLGTGGNSVVCCEDKTQLDLNKIKEILKEWLDTPIQRKDISREWVYANRKHRIIVEKYIDSSKESGGLIDYKFFCFKGKVHYIYVITNRELGNGAELGIFNRDFQILNARRVDEKPLKHEIKTPPNLKEMIEISEKLAYDFPEVRVDLYNVGEQILFGELTFFDGSGYMKFEPDQFDFEMGKAFEI